MDFFLNYRYMNRANSQNSLGLERSHIKCEYSNIKEIIEAMPIMNKRLDNIKCLKFNNRRAIYKVFDNKRKVHATAKFIIKHNIDYESVFIIDFIKNNPHPNLANAYEIGQVGNFYVILMEYIEGVRFNEFIKNSNDRVLNRKVILDVLEGLSFLHHHRILHSDIKPANIIVGTDNVARIIDFDMITQINGDYIVKHVIVGTYPYIPREILFEKKYYIKSDVWEFGVTIINSLIDGIDDANDNNEDSIESTQQCIVTMNDIDSNELNFYKYEDIDMSFARAKLDRTVIRLVKDMVKVDVNERASVRKIIKRLKRTDTSRNSIEQ